MIVQHSIGDIMHYSLVLNKDGQTKVCLAGSLLTISFRGETLWRSEQHFYRRYFPSIFEPGGVWWPGPCHYARQGDRNISAENFTPTKNILTPISDGLRPSVTGPAIEMDGVRGDTCGEEVKEME